MRFFFVLHSFNRNYVELSDHRRLRRWFISCTRARAMIEKFDCFVHRYILFKCALCVCTVQCILLFSSTSSAQIFNLYKCVFCLFIFICCRWQVTLTDREGKQKQNHQPNEIASQLRSMRTISISINMWHASCIETFFDVQRQIDLQM